MVIGASVGRVEGILPTRIVISEEMVRRARDAAAREGAALDTAVVRTMLEAVFVRNVHDRRE